MAIQHHWTWSKEIANFDLRKAVGRLSSNLIEERKGLKAQDN